MTRIVTKQLAGVEDLLLGSGSEVQVRYSGSQTIKRINSDTLPYDSDAAVISIRDKLAKKPEVLTNIAALQALDTDVEAELYVDVLGYYSAHDGGGGLFYLDTSDTSTAEDLATVFNPDNVANGRWKRVSWFDHLTEVGNSNVTVDVLGVGTFQWSTTLTANRTATLPSANRFKGLKYRFIKKDTSAFTVDVGGIKTLPAGYDSFLEIQWDGSAWQVTAYSQTSNVGAGTLDLATDLRKNLGTVIRPNSSKGFKDLYAQGAFPFWHSKQFGAANFGELPNGELGELHFGLPFFSGLVGVGESAGWALQAQPFKVAKDCEVETIWIMPSFEGDPTDNLTIEIWSDDGSGDPNVVLTNGAYDSIDLHSIPSHDQYVEGLRPVAVTKASGVFPTLTAGTQYHIVIGRSGGIDGVNYPTLRGNPLNFGLLERTGYAVQDWNGTVWGISDLANFWFFLETDNCKMLNSGGLFSNGKFNFYPAHADILNQSSAITKANKDLEISHEEGTFHLAGSGFSYATAEAPLIDSIWGIRQNRITATLASGNVVKAYLYENDGTIHTLTGTTAINTGDHTIDVIYRAKGDGSDYFYLYVDGVLEDSAVSQTLTLDSKFASLGHTHFGGGFAPFNSVGQDYDPADGLPSADGWTYGGTATEADGFEVFDNVLHQKDKHTTGTTAWYYKTMTGVTNALGWGFEAEIDIDQSNIYTNVYAPLFMRVDDNTNKLDISLAKEHLLIGDTTTRDAHMPVNLSKGTHHVYMCGILDDYYIFIDGKLVFDGTAGDFTTSSALRIAFGNIGTNANGSCRWRSLRYEIGGQPKFTTCEISEIAYWAENKVDIIPNLYNTGTIQSIVDLAGMHDEYTKEIESTVLDHSIEGDNIVTGSGSHANPAYPINSAHACVLCTNLKAYGSITLESTTLTAEGALYLYDENWSVYEVYRQQTPAVDEAVTITARFRTPSQRTGLQVLTLGGATSGNFGIKYDQKLTIDYK